MAAFAASVTGKVYHREGPPMLNPDPDSPGGPLQAALPSAAGDGLINVPAAPAPAPAVSRMTRGRAIAETILCSSYPTQVLAATVLAVLGVPPQVTGGGLNPTFVFAVSTLDAVMVVALIVWLLRRQGESLAAVFFGERPVWREAAFGVALVPVVTLGVALVVLAARTLVPTMHNVEVNPLTAFMADPVMAAAFAVLVVAAGGVREEMQRAFQIHRLSGHVCSPLVALTVTSVAFGLGHTIQGRDVALATFGLGLFWGTLYLRRGSLVAAAVSHGLFNLGQVVIGLAASRVAVP